MLSSNIIIYSIVYNNIIYIIYKSIRHILKIKRIQNSNSVIQSCMLWVFVKKMCLLCKDNDRTLFTMNITTLSPHLPVHK